MVYAQRGLTSTIDSGRTMPEETRMVGREVWEAIQRMAQQDGFGVSELARRFELDRKTVRRVLRETAWRPYQRASRTDTLLAEHTAFLTERAPQVDYSARILYSGADAAAGLSRQLRHGQALRRAAARGYAVRRSGR